VALGMVGLASALAAPAAEISSILGVSRDKYPGEG
jgi:hypothetical protein